MRKTPQGVVYSATDVVNFLECGHITTLDLIDLVTPLERAGDDDQAQLLQDHGIRHEQAYLKQLAAEKRRVITIESFRGDFQKAVAETLEGLRSGADVVYQAALAHGVLAGYADFLIRVELPSRLGAFSYEVEDTKLARAPKAKFLIQLCFYSSLLAKIQGVVPERMHVVLGDGTRVSFRVADYMSYFATLQERFLQRVADGKARTYPERCSKCGECQWSRLCEEQWEKDDHLNLVANIKNDQIRKLSDAGINTLQALARLPRRRTIPRLHADTLEKLRHQAALQWRARRTGETYVDLLPIESGTLRGFARLPKPDSGDLYFDMEGDPLEVDGLEYLFGVGTVIGKGLKVRPFWAHTREEEKLAFQAFMDFVTEHLRKHPAAHIYHYAPYEVTALKRLMSLHGTREREVDDLLRQSRLVDLYKVVSEGIRTSEPSYSLKNIEHFYMPAREGDVLDAGASIVFYERWRQTQDGTLLEKIRAYNEDDVRSTQLLHRWLCNLRPKSLPWRPPGVVALSSTTAGEATAEETRLEQYRQRLLAGIPDDGSVLTPDQQLRVLAFQLLAFHRREQKPQWWAMFNRMELDEAELIEDKECLGGLTLDPKAPPKPDKQSVIYTYRYPEQEAKLKSGDECTRADNGESLGTVVLDIGKRRAQIRIGKNRKLPRRLNLGPGAPIKDSVLRARTREFAESVVANDRRFSAVKNLLMKQPPRVAGRAKGAPLIGESAKLTHQVIEIVAGLKNSYVFIQGPPGAGKTYTGSHVIAELLKRGKTVGVSSNSHKAINNLLANVVEVAKRHKIRFRGFKKTSASNADSHFDSALFDNSDQIKSFDPKAHALFAGTAWAFAAFPSPAPLDYLFVDEAGQVSLANLVVMGLVAKNIVLLGDQMQLGQPIQGVHPGRSGESTLEYLLDGRATIPPDEGIFLPLTWRMHPAVCEFISQAVYDGRLHAAPGLEKQALILRASAHSVLAPVGVRYFPVEHEGCSQESTEEATTIKAMYLSLLDQHYVDAKGRKAKLELKDILVVSPYNMQVNLLARMLPDGARVGTVDKFQGQQAEVVLVSMTTSSGEDLPRNIEFLYSKNRLNVAISRAKCLAVVVANPKLLSVKCSTPEQMALINTLCWVMEWDAKER